MSNSSTTTALNHSIDNSTARETTATIAFAAIKVSQEILVAMLL